MNDNMGIGRRIASYRKLKRLTQFELAEAVGVSKDILLRLKRGEGHKLRHWPE